MLVDMDMNLFNLQVKVTRLVMAILSEKNEYSADINLSISHSPDDDHRVIRCARIFLDPEDEHIKIDGNESDDPLAWDDLDIAAQYRIAQQLYTRRLSNSLYRSLSC